MQSFGAVHAQSISPSEARVIARDAYIYGFPLVDNYRVQYSGVVRNGGFGKFDHTREPAPLDKQAVIRLNRDTLYSSAVFDLDAGPVTITLPEAGKRFMSLQVIDEDQYTHGVHYRPGSYTLTRKEIGTRYVVTAVRTLVDPASAEDTQKAHALQDAIKVSQPGGPGHLEIPNWDQASQKKVRDALLVLATTLPDTNRMYGKKSEVDPLRFLIGAANGWGANPAKEALYLNIVPSRNDGNTVHTLKVKDVPVDGFWSISLYNAQGYYEPNKFNAYSLNNITAAKSADGTVTVPGRDLEISGGTSNQLSARTKRWRSAERRPRSALSPSTVDRFQALNGGSTIVDSTGQCNTCQVWETQQQVLVKSVLIASSARSCSLSHLLIQPQIVAKLRRSRAMGFRPLSIRMEGVASTG